MIYNMCVLRTLSIQLYNRLKDNFGINHLINFAHAGLASQKDYDETVAFFEVRSHSSLKSDTQHHAHIQTGQGHLEVQAGITTKP